MALAAGAASHDGSCLSGYLLNQLLPVVMDEKELTKKLIPLGPVSAFNFLDNDIGAFLGFARHP
jgi:hypothetical protein